MKERSISGLTEDLRCANAEARGYLEELVPIREEVKKLRKENGQLKSDMEFAQMTLGVLIRALLDAQKAAK